MPKQRPSMRGLRRWLATTRTPVASRSRCATRSCRSRSGRLRLPGRLAAASRRSSSARNDSDSSSCAAPGSSGIEAELRRRCAAPPASTPPRRCARDLRAIRAAPRSRRRCRRSGARRAGARRFRSSGSPSAGRRVEQAGGAQPVELRALTERDRTPGVAAALAHAEAQVLAVSDGRRRHRLAPGHEQRDVRVAEAERREPGELRGEAERRDPMRRRPRRLSRPRRDRRGRARVGVRVANASANTARRSR